jgi:chorismate synthase
MSGNTFGKNFRITTFGESHGPGIGVVIDGVPAGLEMDETFLQAELDRRRPGQSKVTTPRNEADRAEILSGVFEGKTTGCPLAILIRNSDQHSSDYSNVANLFRPGHADYTYFQKYGIRDYRGGGRSSGRETAARVAAGAVAKMFLKTKGIQVRACALNIAGIKAEKFLWDEVENNIVRSPDPEAAVKMVEAIQQAQLAHDSVGGIVLCELLNVPAGLGEPAFDKLDAELAHAMLSVGAVKGIEFGAGFEVASMRGSENNDAITPEGFSTNNAGGILGGISNGDTIVFKVAVKPTPSIARKQQSIDTNRNPVDVEIKGRHDPCLVPRMVPVIEAMAALVLADALV